MTDLTRPVLYAAYGSNLAADRLACYLRGGSPAGSQVTHPVPEHPEDVVAVGLGWIPGRLLAAGFSRNWNSPACDVDLDAPGQIRVALYLQSTRAVLRLWAGEAGATEVPEKLPAIEGALEGVHPWRHLSRVALCEPVAGHTHAYVVHCRGEAPRSPAVGAAYLATMARGLAEHGEDRQQIRSLLAPIAAHVH